MNAAHGSNSTTQPKDAAAAGGDVVFNEWSDFSAIALMFVSVLGIGVVPIVIGLRGGPLLLLLDQFLGLYWVGVVCAWFLAAWSKTHRIMIKARERRITIRTCWFAFFFCKEREYSFDDIISHEWYDKVEGGFGLTFRDKFRVTVYNRAAIECLEAMLPPQDRGGMA